MKKWLRYARIGIDTQWSDCPIQINGAGQIVLEDGLYDLADTPLMMEMILLAFPLLEKDNAADYWNPKTQLFAQIWEE